jgi:hypothetical protein
MASDFEEGLLMGVLVGEGHFGGDGRQPHVVLRMHVRHEALFRWIDRAFPGGRLYGPYTHGGRNYLQWMARGAFLREMLLPVLERRLSPDVDGPSWERFVRMRDAYARQLGVAPAPPVDLEGEPAGGPAPPHREPDLRRVEAIFERLRRSSGEPFR